MIIAIGHKVKGLYDNSHWTYCTCAVWFDVEVNQLLPKSGSRSIVSVYRLIATAIFIASCNAGIAPYPVTHPRSHCDLQSCDISFGTETRVASRDHKQQGAEGECLGTRLVLN